MSISTDPLHPPYFLEIGVLSQKGPFHDVNEDAYRIDVERGLFLLADGMGGYQAGEVASRIAVDVIYETLANDAYPSKEKLITALLAAHQAILTMAQEQEAYWGMGTTALIGWVRIPELVLWTAHVGNSRAYLWRNGQLRQLTEDHTLLNELRKANRLPRDPRDWPSPAILSQALGVRQQFLSPQLSEWTLQPGDRLLFCSDGLSDVLTNEEINETLSKIPSPQQACEQLVLTAQSKGAHDDLTVIIVNIEAVKEKTAVQTVQMEVEL